MPEHTRDVIACAEAVAADVVAAADQLWQLAEVGLTEHRSSTYLKDRLREHGFAITRDGCGGLPTAFVAEYGTGTPIIGILAEYDALPGLGNAAVAHAEPRADGVAAGHGCGHNLIGSGALGAALALRSWLEQSGTPGTLRLFGCPAEENWSGKALMARADVFDGLDAALHWPRSTGPSRLRCARRPSPTCTSPSPARPPTPATTPGTAAARCTPWSCSHTA